MATAAESPERRRVVAHSGYRGEQEPRALIDGDRRIEVAAIDSRWVEPQARYFRVRLDDGRRILLRHDPQTGWWSTADDDSSRVRPLPEPGAR